MLLLCNILNFYKINQQPEILVEKPTIPTVTICKSDFNLQNIQIIYDDRQLSSKDTSFKAFMDYRHITDKTSEQWTLQQLAYTDENGLRKIDDYFCVAVGTYFADKCGEKLLIILENDQIIPVIVADLKSDKHTDDSNLYTPLKDKNNKNIVNKESRKMVNILEFIVDADKISNVVKKSGDISDFEKGIKFAGEIKMVFKIHYNKF